MKKIIAITLITLSSLAFANFTDVSPGDKISASLFNQIQQTIDGILDIKVTNGENLYSAFVSSTGVVSNESGDWLNGDCSIVGSQYECTPQAGHFSARPNY